MLEPDNDQLRGTEITICNCVMSWRLHQTMISQKISHDWILDDQVKPVRRVVLEMWERRNQKYEGAIKIDILLLPMIKDLGVWILLEPL